MAGFWEENFRENLKRRREALDLTQTDIARAMKARGFPFHQQTVQRIESGERPIRLDEAFVLAESVNATVESLTERVDGRYADALHVVDRLRLESRATAEGIRAAFKGWLPSFHELEEIVGRFASSSTTPTIAESLITAWLLNAVDVASEAEDLLGSLHGIYGNWPDEEEKHVVAAAALDDWRDGMITHFSRRFREFGEDRPEYLVSVSGPTLVARLRAAVSEESGNSRADDASSADSAE